MEKILLFYYPEKEINPRRGIRIFSGITLKKGINHLTPEQFETLQQHEVFNDLMDLEVMELISSDTVKDVGIKSLNGNKLTTLIDKTSDPDLLSNWLLEEKEGKNRKLVLARLEKKIKELVKIEKLTNPAPSNNPTENIDKEEKSTVSEKPRERKKRANTTVEQETTPSVAVK